MIDIGNLHVIDYYLHRQFVQDRLKKKGRWRGTASATDFDIETEQREGWAYD